MLQFSELGERVTFTNLIDPETGDAISLDCDASETVGLEKIHASAMETGKKIREVFGK